jgi:hypothetical protein
MTYSTPNQRTTINTSKMAIPASAIALNVLSRIIATPSKSGLMVVRGIIAAIVVSDIGVFAVCMRALSLRDDLGTVREAPACSATPGRLPARGSA